MVGCEYHSTVDLVSKLKEREERTISFVGAMIHGYLADDLRALMILLSYGLRHQTNLVLRRIIEYILYSVFIDLINRFGDFFQIFWYPKEWKSALRGQRLSDKDLKRRLRYFL